MATWYKRGVANVMQGIVADAENFVNYPEDRNKIEDKIKKSISVIEKFYSEIPFSRLDKDYESSRQFKPLFEVSD